MLIPPEEIVRSVITENPWWTTSMVPKRFQAMARRAYFDPFAKLVQNRKVNRAVILLGPRRVGKTVMTQHLVHKLIEDGADPRSIMYVSIDTPTYTNLSLQYFIDLLREHNEFLADDELTIIFDEIQYLAGWERHLKVLVDKNANVRFIASGSAAAALKLASVESGAGRFTDFMLPPLTFAEYLEFIGKTSLVDPRKDGDISYENVDMQELNSEFVNYINYGGYPEAVVSESIRSDAARYIKNDIIDKVLLRDLPQLYGITNIQELNKLFTALAYQTGQETSLENISKNSGISKPTIGRYIEYLEAAFLLFRVRRVDNNCKTFTRERTFKVYLTNPSMRAALFSPVQGDSETMGQMVETAIFSQWFHSNSLASLHYARWKKSGRARSQSDNFGEIDIVSVSGEMHPNWIVEIKWSDAEYKKETCWNSIREFTEGKRQISGGLMTTKSEFSMKTVSGKYFDVYPSAVYCYLVGKNSAKGKNERLISSMLADESVDLPS